MITVKGENISFVFMGLFEGDENWKHPNVAIETLELVFVTEGVVYINENGVLHTLEKNDLFFLDPNVRHFGYRKSGCRTKFYWMHFSPFDYTALNMKKIYRAENANELKSIFAACNHLCASNGEKELIELKILGALKELYGEKERKNNIAYKIADYVHANSDRESTVKEIAAKFGYNPNYLSKLFYNTFSVTLKKYAENERLAAIKNYLMSSPYSVKEISDLLNFSDSNALIKFFKYHTGSSPAAYRNSRYGIHTNHK